jgi:hypothetical protein
MFVMPQLTPAVLCPSHVAASGQAAASVLAALPAEPERVWSFPLVEGLIPTVVYVPGGLPACC